jgi:hypothetical protein
VDERRRERVDVAARVPLADREAIPSCAMSRWVKRAPTAAVPTVAPISRKRLFAELAVPTSSARASFCTASMTLYNTSPSPTPSSMRLAKRLAQSHSALTASVHAGCHLMTRLARNRTLPTAIAVLLVSVPAAGTSATIARDALGPPPLIDVAVIPETPRPRRVRRYAAARAIQSLLVQLLCDAGIRRVSRILHLGPQPRAKAWHARGPPGATTRP